MTKKNSILLFVLAFQFVLVVWLSWQNSQSYTAQNKGFALFNEVDVLTASEIDIISENGEGASLILQKTANQWVLPNSVKVEMSKVSDLLNKLALIGRSWPVATSAESQQRFEVSNDVYQRKVTLDIAARKYTFFMGTSPGYRQVHVRADGSENVYALRLNSFDFSVDKSDWFARDQLQIKEKITAIKAGDYAFSLDDNGTWSVQNIQAYSETDSGSTATANNLINAQRGSEIANHLSNLILSGISDNKTINNPTERLRISTDKGQEITYLLLQQENEYFIQQQGQSVVFTLNADSYNNLLPILLPIVKEEKEESNK